jgi:transcriptional antiterminator NusG
MREGVIRNTKEATWYTVKVQANRERSVAEKLRLDVEKEGLKNVKNVLIPIEKHYYVKEGKKMSRDKIVYPGYIFVEVEGLGELQYVLRQIQGNSGLLKDRSGSPIPISKSEIDRMMGQVAEKAVVDDTNFIVNEIVNINNGAFSGFKATVEEVYSDKKKVKLAVSIFGRITYMDLDITQIDKVVNE